MSSLKVSLQCTPGSDSSMVRVFKIDAKIQNSFPTCICSIALLQTGRLLPRIGSFLPNYYVEFLLAEVETKEW